MNSFQETRRRLLGLCFILGSTLTLLSAILYMMGVGVNPGLMGWGSYVEGFLGYFSYLLLLPAFLALASWLGEYRPKLAVVALIFVLIGIGGGAVMNMGYRVIVPEMILAGASQDILDAMNNNMMDGKSSPWMSIVVFSGVLGPLASILIGVGYLLAKKMQTQAIILIVAGILFPMGQALMIGPLGLFYTIALFLWTIVLVPIGLKLLAGTDPIGGRSSDGPLIAAAT